MYTLPFYSISFIKIYKSVWKRLVVPIKQNMSYSAITIRKSQNLYVYYLTIITMITGIIYLFGDFSSRVKTFYVPALAGTMPIVFLYNRWYKALDKLVMFLFLVCPNLMSLGPTDFLAGPVAIVINAILQFNIGHSRAFTVFSIVSNFVLYKLAYQEIIVERISNMNNEQIIKVILNSIDLHFSYGFTYFIAFIMVQNANIKSFRKLDFLKQQLAKSNVELTIHKTKLQEALNNLEMAILSFSHELKNSLNGVLGNISLATESANLAQVQRYLKDSNICGQILKYYISNILDSGKISNGHLDVVCETVDLKSFVTKIWSLQREAVSNKRLRPTLNIQGTLPAFLALDQERVTQCIMNLISNAVKFTSKGAVTISVSWSLYSKESPNNKEGEKLGGTGKETQLSEEQKCNSIETINASSLCTLTGIDEYLKGPEKGIAHPKHFHSTKSINHTVAVTQSDYIPQKAFHSIQPGLEGCLNVWVSDTGSGITDDRISTLFRKFSKPQASHVQRHKGVGIGLWITKRILAEMGGDVFVSSKPGHGSVFQLRIPAKSAIDIMTLTTTTHNSEGLEVSRNEWPNLMYHQQQSLNNKSQPKPKLKLRLKSKLAWPLRGKALIADDDSFNVELLANYLKKLAIPYDAVYDGEALLNKVKESSIDEYSLIITDNNMPKMDGIDAAREIADFLEREGRSMIPVVLVSGDYHLGGLSKKKHKGVVSFIAKPIQFSQLESLFLRK